MKPKPLNWQDNIATFMGITLSVFPNNSKWDCRLVNDLTRSETQSGFNTIDEAKQYAEHILLNRELHKYFES